MGIIDEYVRQNPGSKEAYEGARRFLPSGNTRTVLYWPPFPLCMRAGRGTRLWDVDGNERIDFNFNNTTLIMGHNHPRVIEAAEEQLARGTVLGAPTETEPLLAEELVRRLKSAERVRFTPSGTEANMQAIRTARAYTGKDLVAKCEGAYHGSWDAIDISVTPPLDQAGPRETPNSVRQQAGIPEGVLRNTLTLPFNDADAAVALIEKHRDELAAVIVEPVQRDLPPEPGFLEALREATERHGIVLIFDEVIAFRVGYHGAQGRLGVTPDITTLGKIIGGGFPVGAYASTEEFMEPLAIPEAKFPDYRGPRLGFSGTFNAHPVTMAAGLAVLKELRPPVYDEMDRTGERMRDGLRKILEEAGINAFVGGMASFFHVVWTTEKVRDYRSAATGDRTISRYFTIDLMNRGVFLLGHPNVSAVTTNEEVLIALDTMTQSLEGLIPTIENIAPQLV
ncbi:aspartate aminotransferase family protein [Candidatus Bathyarchaeota archaeon]|nr:aspartate aminotransferase family protein [Candidatus Bathyarchaeota archaeon]